MSKKRLKVNFNKGINRNIMEFKVSFASGSGNGGSSELIET